jgi:hypothetical protein
VETVPGVMNMVSIFECVDPGEASFEVHMTDIYGVNLLANEPVRVSLECFDESMADALPPGGDPFTMDPEQGIIGTDSGPGVSQGGGPEGQTEDEEEQEAASPQILVEPEEIGFSHTIGGTSCPQFVGSLYLSSSGEAIEWSVSVGVPWLNVSGVEGSTPAEVSVLFNCDVNPVPQSLNGVITIDAAGGSTSVEVRGDLR